MFSRHLICRFGYWLSDSGRHPSLAHLAQDLIAAPASQAYSKRVFSLCRDPTARKRNRACISLLCRSFLKRNEPKILSSLSICNLCYLTQTVRIYCMRVVIVSELNGLLIDSN